MKSGKITIKHNISLVFVAIPIRNSLLLYIQTIRCKYEQRYKQAKGGPGRKEANQQVACRAIGQRPCHCL